MRKKAPLRKRPDELACSGQVVRGHEVGGRIRVRRQTLGLSVNEVARRAGISPGTVNTVERGRLTVQVDLLLRVLDTVGLTVVEALCGTRDGVPLSTAAFEEELARRARMNMGELLKGIAKAVETPSAGSKVTFGRSARTGRRTRDTR